MIKTFDGFAGYGGLSFAFKKAEIEFECVGFSETDKFAIECYNMNHSNVENYGDISKININHPNVKNYGDITKIDPKDLPDFDLFTGGFPCQDVSIAGKRDLSKGRTMLFDDIIRINEVKQPKYMMLENVKGLLSANNGKLWTYIKSELYRIGYGITYKVMNSKEHGIPQNRERIWILCKLGGWGYNEFKWPNKEELKIFVKDIIEDEVDEKYYLTEKQILKIKETMKKVNQYESDLHKKGIADFRFDEGLRIRKDGTSPCLAASNRENISNSILVHNTQSRSPDRPSLTKKCPCGSGKLYQKCCGVPAGSGHLSKQDGTTYCLDSGNNQCLEFQDQWRRLTPKECFRLMGFLDDQIVLKGISDSQCYKLAGNGWDINIVSKILKNLFKED